MYIAFFKRENKVKTNFKQSKFEYIYGKQTNSGGKKGKINYT